VWGGEGRVTVVIILLLLSVHIRWLSMSNLMLMMFINVFILGITSSSFNKLRIQLKQNSQNKNFKNFLRRHGN